MGTDRNTLIARTTRRHYFCKELNCNNKITMQTALYGGGRCASCASIFRESYKSLTFKGRIHTEETKEKISDSNIGRKFNKNHIERLSESHKGKHYSLKTEFKKGQNKGKNNPRFGKLPLHGKWKKYKDINMRSSWEVIYVKYLDKHNIIWTYESKTFDLGNTTYTPDFYLPESNRYIEVKGYWRDDAKKKFKLFKKLYPKINIKVIQKENLKEIGVL